MNIDKILAQADGSGRELRQVQIDAITQILSRWNPKRHFVLGAPVASGKSLILRTIQRAMGGSIITPTNQLVSQYRESYESLNYLIGGSHYHCPEYSMPCSVASMRYNCKGCVDTGCALANARDAYRHGEPTLFNVMSAFVNRSRFKINPGINYIDEAHALCSNVRSLTTTTIKFGPTERAILRELKLEKKDLVSEIKLCNFLETKIARYEKMMRKTKDEDAIQKYFDVIENTKLTFEALSAHPEVYVVEFDDGHLRVLPLFAPRNVLDKIIGNTGVLTSGTFVKHDLEELLGPGKYERYDCDSPIPADRRRVVWDPANCGFSYDTLNPAVIAEKILSIYNARGKEPLFVHATYNLAERLKSHLFGNDVIFHDKQSKIDAVDQFKKNGGLFIGSGLAEGLDLAGPMFQAQVITQLSFPSLSDLYTKKRKALQGGQDWYNGETAKTFLQAIGRTTRGPEDNSTTFVIDSRFSRVYSSWKREGLIPKYVEQAVRI